MVFSDPCADCLTARVEANISYQGSGAQAFELCRFLDQHDVIEQVDAVGDVGGWQQLFELQVFIRADHARGNLSSARVGEIDADAAFLQTEFLQFGGDRLGEVREGEGRNFDVVTFLTHSAGIPGPVNEFAVPVRRNDYSAAPWHEGAAEVVQAPLPGSNICVETGSFDRRGHVSASRLEIDGGE